MLIWIDPANERPIYEQIADSVRRSAAQADLVPGDKLPTASDVATGLGINKHTVLRAYQGLRDEGLVDLRRGRGVTITPLADELAKLRKEAEALARRASSLGIAQPTLASLFAFGGDNETESDDVDTPPQVGTRELAGTSASADVHEQTDSQAHLPTPTNPQTQTRNDNPEGTR